MVAPDEGAAKADALQARKIAVEIAKRIQADRNRILGSLGKVTSPVAVESQAVERSPASSGDSTVADELEKLNKLWREGALSDEEFAKAKARLLEP